MSRGSSFAATIAVVAILALLPFVAARMDLGFLVIFAARVLIYAIAASALNIALGFGGMVSLGHALFLGIGMYSAALPAHYGIDCGWAHLAITVLASAAVGWATGWISLRTAGIAFIMITLAFAQMGYFVIVSLKQFGGDDGMAVVTPSNFSGLRLDSPVAVYQVALAVAAGLVIWIRRLRVSPFGMALRAGRQNARRVASIGIPLIKVQLGAYVISAVICGIAGLLLANLNAYASPSTMSWLVSGELIVMVVLGGMGTAIGPLLGALVYLGAEEVLKGITDSWMAVFGLGILAVALAGKNGIAGWSGSTMRRPGSVASSTARKLV